MTPSDHDHGLVGRWLRFIRGGHDDASRQLPVSTTRTVFPGGDHGRRFIDTIVGTLLNAQQHAARTGRRLRVTGVSDEVRTVMRTCDPAKLLDGGESAAADDMPSRRTASSFTTRGAPPYLPASTATPSYADAVREAWEQQRIDGEVRSTRRRLLARLRRRLVVDPLAMLDPGFMAAADRLTLLQAVVATATTVGAAAACDVQLYDRNTQSLKMAYQEGFDTAFLDYFATVDVDCPTACGAALTSGEPVLIGDITQSRIFARQPSLDVMLAAGTRAVQSYPCATTRTTRSECCRCTTAVHDPATATPKPQHGRQRRPSATDQEGRVSRRFGDESVFIVAGVTSAGGSGATTTALRKLPVDLLAAVVVQYPSAHGNARAQILRHQSSTRFSVRRRGGHGCRT
jgi:hypothetical protein